jgi:MFS family permease
MTATVESPRVLQTWAAAELPVKAVLVGTFVNKLGAFLQTFLVLFLTHRGFSEVQAGLALGCFGAGGLAGVLTGGALADRLGPRLATLTSMAGSAALLIAVLYVRDLPTMLGVVTLVGVVGQLYRPASATLISELTPKDRQVMIFALYRWSLNLGTTVAPLLGAALISVSYDLLFWSEAVAAGAFAVIAAIALPKRKREPAGQAQAPPVGYRKVLADRRYVRYLLAIAVNSMVYIQYIATLPLAMRDHGLPTVWFGVVVALNGFLVITCELFVTRFTQRWRVRRVITAGFVLLGAGYSIYALPFGLAAFLTGTLVWTAAEVVGGPTMLAYPGLIAPAHLRGRYIGAMQVMFSVGGVVGPAAGVALYRLLGDQVWVLSGAICLLALAFALSGMTAVRTSDD